MNDWQHQPPHSDNPQPASENRPTESPMPWAMNQPPADAAFQHDADAEAAPRRRINEGLLLLMLVLTVAAAVLFVMRKSGSASVDKSISHVEAQIEAALSQMSSADAAKTGDPKAIGLIPQRTDDIIAMFVNDPTDKQVPLDQLKKNPFSFGNAPTTAATASVAVVDPAEQQRQYRIKILRDELGRMKLQTVMQGRTPLAVISGKVVRQGDQYGSFTVAAIDGRSVVLTADGNTYRLEMSEPTLGNSFGD